MNQINIIAVIGGTGAEGSGLALRFADAGFRVVVGSRDSQKAAATASELNNRLSAPTIVGMGNRDAASAAEVVILTVPYAAQAATVADIRGMLDGKILIDATVPLMPPKVSRVQLPASGSAVADIQASLGESVRVVSAFQNVSAHKLQELGAKVDCDVLVCADDAEARAVAIQLIERIGLRGIDAGPICNSAAAEALTSILININRKYKVPGSGIRISGLND